MVRILAIRVIDRIKEAGHTQEVLSTHSAIIKSRLGFHELNEDRCSREGYIILYLKDDEEGDRRLMHDLDKIYGIELKRMNFGAEQPTEQSIAVGADIAVLGILIKNRTEIISEVQKTLTSFGCTIRTRLGINEEIEGEDTGLIILELIGENSEMNKLVKRLEGIRHLSLGVISFS
ncbi:MAG: hypothetical protein V2I34_09840 [Bacteroidales bacterium]|jgi:hypothetical protein|nr:hypothetical protein [Bacteroidales bacterium]